MLSIPLIILLSPFSDLSSPWDGPSSPVDVLYNDKHNKKKTDRGPCSLYPWGIVFFSGDAPPNVYPRTSTTSIPLPPPTPPSMMMCLQFPFCVLCVCMVLSNLPYNMHVFNETDECIDRIENRAKTKKVHGIKRITLCKQYMGMLGGTERWKERKKKKKCPSFIQLFSLLRSRNHGVIRSHPWAPASLLANETRKTSRSTISKRQDKCFFSPVRHHVGRTKFIASIHSPRVNNNKKKKRENGVLVFNRLIVAICGFLSSSPSARAEPPNFDPFCSFLSD